MSDAINPDHYKRLPAEAIEIIESAIDKAPSNQDAYLHGQVLKYILRCWNKNGIEDLKKAKWYLDRLVDSLDEYEQQKAADLQSIKDHPFGKLKEPAWTPKIGDWARINAPEPGDPMHTKTLEGLDGQTLQVVGLSEFDKRYAAFESDHGSFYVLIDLLEPAEQPKAPLNSDTIPEGYRKLNDSSEEPRQLGDLRWSVAEKRYIEIGVDEIGYANRDNWAACRKVEPVIKQSLNTKPPDGWRFLEVGEVIRKGDQGFKNGRFSAIDPLIEFKLQSHWKPVIRRNRFEVGEKVVHVDDRHAIPYEIDEYIYSKDAYVVKYKDGHYMYHWSKLAPYIEDAK